jgi:hypothetical protein
VAVLWRSRKKVVIFFQIKKTPNNSVFILQSQVNIEEISSIKMQHATPVAIVRRSRKKDNNIFWNKRERIIVYVLCEVFTKSS